MRLTYSNVTATVALFVALGGTSYAVSTLPRNSVGSSQIKDKSVSRADLAADAVVAGPRGPRGSQGANGLSGSQGVNGVPGAQGERGPSNVRIAPSGSTVQMSATANQTKVVRRMDSVPAGSWVLHFDANAFLVTTQGMYVVCVLKTNGDYREVVSMVVGQAALAIQEGPMAIDTVVQHSSSFNVTVECSQDQAGTSTTVAIVRPKIIATQVADVATTP